MIVYKKRHSSSQSGVALVGSLLLLALMVVLGLGMVLTSSSDMLINGYYRNARGSFYAADSGIHVARQLLVAQVAASVPETFAAGTAPIPPGTDAAARSAVLSAYSSPSAVSTGGNSWTGRYRITNVEFGLVANPPQPVVTSQNQAGLANGFQYTYNYRIVSEGTTNAGGTSIVEEAGTLIFNAAVSPGGPMNLSFAAWGMFIDNYNACSSSTLVPGTISGPVFTNGAWTFGTSGQYIFTDNVGSVDDNLGYRFNSTSCFQSPNSSYKSGTQTIAPTFQSGYKLNQNPLPLPDNDFSQRRAILDGLGTDTSPVTNIQMNAVLRNANNNAYPLLGASSGVYMPYRTIDGVRTVTGGGILVEGNASVVLSTSGTSTQIFTITQGSTVSTISINPAANGGAGQTIFTTGSNSVTLFGVPTNLTNPSGPIPGTMLYVDGSITALRGPSTSGGTPAIQDASAITITAQSDITVTGDLIYKTKPVTTSNNEIPGTPPATLIPGNHNGQVLGLYTANGDVILKNAQSNGNLRIDASIATIRDGGDGGIINGGNRINTLTIIGGRIQNDIKNINSTTRNVFFDRRFSQGGFAPPWFPSSLWTPAGVSTASMTSSVQRTRWANLTAH